MEIKKEMILSKKEKVSETAPAPATAGQYNNNNA
jgi:hypothetical protein